MITGQFTSRSIADQTNLSYLFYLQLDNTSGLCDIGISGANKVNYIFQNGRIYDYLNNYIYSYNANQWISISGNIGQSGCNCFINNNPIYIGQPIPTGIYNQIYINPTNVNVTIYPKVFGQIPNYIINANSTYASGQSLTGYFTNNSTQYIRIFSGTIIDTNSNFTFTSYPTGDFIGTQPFILDYITLSNVADTVPLMFYTNFGTITGVFNTSGIIFNQFTEFFNLYPNSGTIASGQTNQYVLNYNIAQNEIFTIGLNTTGNYGYWQLATGVSSLNLINISSGNFTNKTVQATGIGVGNPQSMLVSVFYSGISGYATLNINGLYNSYTQSISGV